MRCPHCGGVLNPRGSDLLGRLREWADGQSTPWNKGEARIGLRLNSADEKTFSNCLALMVRRGEVKRLDYGIYQTA